MQAMSGNVTTTVEEPSGQCFDILEISGDVPAGQFEAY